MLSIGSQSDYLTEANGCALPSCGPTLSDSSLMLSRMEAVMNDEPRNDIVPSSGPAHVSVMRRSLGGAALVLALAPPATAISAMTLVGPAIAAEAPGQPAPDFADLVDKVSPAVVSIRVREGAAQTTGDDSEP